MFAALILLGALTQALLVVPDVPAVHSGQLNTYMQEHGKRMFEDFARIRLQNVHPGGKDAVRDETVATTAQSMYQRAVTLDEVAKHKYLTAIHARISEATT